MNSYPIHKAVFDECFEEGQFKPLRLQWKKFGDSLFRINHHKDISIIAPLFYVTKTDVDLDLDRGDLVIPICKLLAVSTLDEEHSFHVLVLPLVIMILMRQKLKETLKFRYQIFFPSTLTSSRT